MFGRATPEAVRLPYRDVAKPGVRLLRETVTAIDPERRRVTTDAGVHVADVLVIALGADYDFDATPGLTAGRKRVLLGRRRRATRRYHSGLLRTAGPSWACATRPSSAPRHRVNAPCCWTTRWAARGVRDACEISFVLPLPSPVPPSPETSAALIAEFEKRGIELIPGRRVDSIDSARSVAVLDDGDELSFDLFLGVPKHRAPDVVIASGMTEDGYVPVDTATLRTRYPGVYAVGDVAYGGRAQGGGVRGGRRPGRGEAADRQAPQWRPPDPYHGRGSLLHRVRTRTCRSRRYRLPVGTDADRCFQSAVRAARRRKRRFGSDRKARWFGS